MVAIFKKELRLFFTTPIGYIFIGSFLLIMNLYFYIVNIAYQASSDLKPIFSTILFVMIFLIPLLTMRLFPEEYKQHTDQLLFTTTKKSPIVIGKFLATLLVFLIALMGTLIWVLIIIKFSTLDYSTFIGNFFAVFCVASSFISVGLFASSQTDNQIIAGVLSFSFFLGFYFLDVASASLSMLWLQAITGWLSLFNRFTDFTLGLFALDDIFYYLSFTIIFLFLTVRVLENKTIS